MPLWVRHDRTVALVFFLQYLAAAAEEEEEEEPSIVIGQAFMGHIGSTELAAYALVATVIVRFSNGILGFPPSEQCDFLDSLELWYNTVLILLTGNMSNAEVAIDALSICLNINGWEMMISLGFLAAASIAYIFTENSEVVAAVESLSDLLAWSILLNSVQPVLSGVAVGLVAGIVAFVNLGSYYLIGVPVGAVLGYVFDFQVKVSIAQERVNKWVVEPEPPSVNQENV
ncbi:hypothetical protein C3L33_02319, partial [Rhododendron williamsianum]